MDRLLTVKQAKAILGTSIPNVNKLVKLGYIKSLNLGGTKIRELELDRFMKDNEGVDFKEILNN